MKVIIKLLAMFSMSFLFFIGSDLAYGAQSLPSSMVIGDESGVYATQEGDYYIDLPSVLPGEIYEKEITIRSLDLDEPFSLALLVDSVEQSGPIDFNQYVTVTLTLDDKEIYSGPLLGNEGFDWSLEPLSLGTYDYGTERVLHAVFTISSELDSDDYVEASELLYRWTFVAVKDAVDPPASSESTSESQSSAVAKPKPKPSGTLPWTGEDMKDMMYKIMLGFLLIMFVVILWKRRKDEE